MVAAAGIPPRRAPLCESPRAAALEYVFEFRPRGWEVVALLVECGLLCTAVERGIYLASLEPCFDLEASRLG